ncbi:MAG TPA: FHA domain-containing protein [Kofleriaceae bacterium]|nr:FHA domain-containing protein [Kofleriaceae bacterium]
MSTARLPLSFRIFQNGALVRETTLTQAVIKIGKVPSAHLRIDDDSVSRMHAVLEVHPHEVCVIDLGSTRGTFVNGKRIHKARLASGDVMQLGDVRVELAMAAPTLAAPALAAGTLAAGTLAAGTIVAAKPPPPPIPPVLRAVPAATPPPPIPRPALAVAPAPDPDGSGAVEVAAMLGDSVIGVKHCLDPRGGKIRAATWIALALGVLCLVTAAAAFVTAVRTSAANDAARDHWVRALHKPAYAFRPRPAPVGVDALAFGGLARGLAGTTLAMWRMRRERAHPYFRIGTAPGVEAAVEHAPAAAFPLVAPAGDDFVFNFAPGIDGELVVDGTPTALGELVAAGRARPSAATAGAIEVPIPPRARIRARIGHATFLVSSVGRPRRFATPLLAHVERRAVAYAIGSLAAHALVLGLLNLAAPETAMSPLTLGDDEDTRMRYARVETTEPAPDRPVDRGDGGGSGQDQAPAAMAGTEGKAGTLDTERTAGHQQLVRRDDRPAMTRADAIAEAREAGVLGSSALLSGVRVLAATGDYENGFDAASVNGAIAGPDGASWGPFGGGRSGTGPGGGCYGTACGTIASANYNTHGKGGPPGDGWSVLGSRGGLRDHNALVPTIGRPEIHGESTYDKAIVRRYIRRHLAEISYCYERQLLAHPTLGGEIKLAFMISPTGSVASSSGEGFDGEVASCLAGVVKAIEFPPPGSAVQVNYPFQFHAPSSN